MLLALEPKFLLEPWLGLNADLEDYAYSTSPLDLSFSSLTTFYFFVLPPVLELTTEKSLIKLPL